MVPLKQPKAPFPLLRPLWRFVITGRIFLTFLRQPRIFSETMALAGRRRRSNILCLADMTSRSTLGRRKYCLSRFLPWGVRRCWWNRPYREKSSFARDDVFPGPWLKVFGCDSVCNICSEDRVFRLTCLWPVSITTHLMLSGYSHRSFEEKSLNWSDSASSPTTLQAVVSCHHSPLYICKHCPGTS